MKKFREFEGKDIDSAIQAACDHFAKDRDDLEIEILSGGSSGIFGLVGVKQARVRAKLRGAVAPQQRGESGEKRAPRKKSTPQKQPAPREAAPEVAPAAPHAAPPVPEPVLEKKRPEKAAEPVSAVESTVPEDAAAVRPEEPAPPRERTVAVPPEDAEAVEAAIRTTVGTLLEAVVGRAELSVNMSTDPIEVVIHDEENSGLIIGRDGQTITALQYLTNRMISQKWPDIPRVQLDAGDYREKQEDQLKKTAEFLADKARRSGRVQSTRPLSSYHRRVVHIALQEDRSIQTRSKGEGPMKRVLIIPKRNGRPKGRRPYQPEPQGE
jgi:spoIIIJ-associated protein